MKYLSLFSGGGGGDWAAQYYKALRPVAYVEFDPKPAAVLQARVNEGWLSQAPVHVMTVAEFTAQHATEGMADVVTGGFPCQPFSVAGKQEAENDPRNAWPETAACLAKVRPAYAFLENVGGLASKPYFGVILSDLAQLGYDVQWRIVSAADVGATHERKRLWIAAFREGLPAPLQISPPLARLVDGEWFHAQTMLFGAPRPYTEQFPRSGIVRSGFLYATQNKAAVGTVALWRTPNAAMLEARRGEVKMHGRTPQDPQVGLADQVGKWLTPNAGLFNDGESPLSNDTRREKVNIGRVLNVEVKRYGWPTVTVHDEKAFHHKEFERNSPPLMAMVHLWPTVLSSDVTKSRFCRDSSGRPSLALSASFWPSPSTPSSGGRVEDVSKLTQRGRTYYRKSGAKVTLHLETAVRPELWPLSGNHNCKGASAASGDGLVTAVKKHGRRWIVAGVFMPDFARGRNKKRISQVNHRLNPRWVECLMGWPIGSSSPEPMTQLIWPAAYGLHPAPPGPYQHSWEPPRVALPDPFRRVSLRALGNGQVPQSAAVAWDLLTSDVLASEVSNE